MNHPLHQQVPSFAVPQRMHPSPSSQNVSAASHPPSYTNSPGGFLYQAEPKRSVFFQCQTSNPQRYSLQACRKRDCVTQDLANIPIQPNVAVQMNYGFDKNKFSTPTHSTSYTDNPRPSVQMAILNRTRKGSDEIHMNSTDGGNIMQLQRRVNIQQSGRIFVQSNIPVNCIPSNGPPINQQHNVQTAVSPIPSPNVSPAMRHLGQIVVPRVITVGHGSPIQQGVKIYTNTHIHSNQQSPSSNVSDKKIAVRFEYHQQPTDKTRLQHLKNKTFNELVCRSHFTEPSTERLVGGSRYSVGTDIGRGLAQSGSLKQIQRNDLVHSMYVRSPDILQIQSKCGNTSTQTTQFTQQDYVVIPERQKSDVESNNASENSEGAGEQDNPFKKDKGPAASPQNAEKQECALKKGMRFLPGQQPPTQPNVQKQDQSKTVLAQLVGPKYSPNSFAKQKSMDSNKGTPTSVQQKVARNMESPRRSCFRNIKLDDFDVGRKLGKGKYGDVYMVQQRRTGFICAMKTVQKKLIKDEEVVHQFCRQIKLQSMLKHQNIVQIYGFFHDAQHVYLLLELCSDGQLTNILRDRKRLPESQVSSLIDQVCSGVDYMHRHNIIHRDLKPQNLIIHSGLVKICDFGWAVDISDGARDTFCGTPLYVSPDVLSGQKYDQKVDLWAIGVLTYQLLVGKVPFKILREEDMRKILQDDVEFPDSVHLSKNAKDFIIRLMHKVPYHRMDMEELYQHPFISECRKANTEIKKIYA